MVFIEKIKKTSPAAIVTAAFIGPGTITTCIKAGYTQSFELLPIMIIATVISILIQSFAAKIGIVTQTSLSRNIMTCSQNKLLKLFFVAIIICAILIGNCAFEAGNITGAALGRQLFFNNSTPTLSIIIVTILAFLVLWNGNIDWLQLVLKMIVLLMSLCFFISAIIVKPSLIQIFTDIWSLNFSKNAVLIGALIGTTIGPYGIFLHSSAAAETWHTPSKLKEMYLDTIISISLGGLMSCFIIIVAACSASQLNIDTLTIKNFSSALEIPLGSFGRNVFLIGLFAAGLSSAITAPLGAAYTISEISSTSKVDTKSVKFRIIWGSVLLVGFFSSIMWGSSPTNLIIFAQLANAFILPIIMIFLLYCLNSKRMGRYKNSVFSNLLVVLLIIISILLIFKNF